MLNCWYITWPVGFKRLVNYLSHCCHFKCYFLKIWFEVLRATAIEITFLWDATPCSCCMCVYIYIYIYIYIYNICQNFGGMFCFFILKIEIACPSETLLSTNDTTRSHTVEDCSVDGSECKQNPTYTITRIKERKAVDTDYLDTLRLVCCLWVSWLNKGANVARIVTLCWHFLISYSSLKYSSVLSQQVEVTIVRIVVLVLCNWNVLVYNNRWLCMTVLKFDVVFSNIGIYMKDWIGLTF